MRWPGLLLGALLALLGTVVQRPVLEVRAENGALLYQQALSPGQPVVLAYRHSVNGQPVREVYSLDPTAALVVQEHAFRVQGAGLGQVEGEGLRIETPGGWTRVVDLNRSVGCIALRVGQPRVDHRLTVRGTTWALSQSLAGARVWLGGRRAPLGQWLWTWAPARPAPPAPWEEAQ